MNKNEKEERAKIVL